MKLVITEISYRRKLGTTKVDKHIVNYWEQKISHDIYMLKNDIQVKSCTRIGIPASFVLLELDNVGVEINSLLFALLIAT